MANPVIWYRIGNGPWNNDGSADPATLTGGIDISAVAKPYLPFGGLATNFFGAQVTFNFGGSAFANTPPAGFSGPSGTTLNPADKSPSISLSGGNLVMSLGGELTNFCARGTALSGNVYFEATPVSTSLLSVAVGVANASASLNPLPQDGRWPYTNAATLSGGSSADGFSNVNGTPHSLGLTFTSGTVLGVALSVDGVFPPTVPVPVPTKGLLRWRGQVGINWLGMPLVGDSFSAVVGLSNSNEFTEYGQPMILTVTTPPLQDDRKRIFVTRFEIDMQVGDGLPATPEVGGTVLLAVSKDGGMTWGPLLKPRSMGAIGDYRTRLRWLNLGVSRAWVFKLIISDPLRRQIIGCYWSGYKGLG